MRVVGNVRLHQEFLYADAHTESYEAAEKEAIDRIRVFQWDPELIAANQLKQCSPTVTIEYPEGDHVLWASVIEKNEEPEFLVSFHDSTSHKSKITERDEIRLSELPKLFELFYRGEFDAIRDALKEREPSANAYDTAWRVLTWRFFIFEAGPAVGAFTYSCFYPSNFINALSVYAVLALVNVGRSIKEGQIAGRYRNVYSRSNDWIDFWLCVVGHALFPLLVLICAAWDIVHSR